MFYGVIESNVDLPSGKLNYVAFGKGKKNLIIIQGLNVRDIKGAGVSLALMYKLFGISTISQESIDYWDE